MQLLLIRHAQPEQVLQEHGVADPGLTSLGMQQAQRIVRGLSEEAVDAIVSSPQLRAQQTAEPLSSSIGLPIKVFDNLAEYDYGLSAYIRIDEANELAPQAYAQIRAGFFPDFIDARAFRMRVLQGFAEVIEQHEHDQTIVVAAHGGVINVYLQEILELKKPLTFPIDYCSMTRVLVSRNGKRRVSSINETAHVRDLVLRRGKSK
ncbi:MAG: histidine phosphatase family protein [Mycobacteriaceae bacterium]